MRKYLGLGALLLAATSANAGTIELGVSNSDPPVTVIASGTNSVSVSNASFGDFFFSGSGSAAPNPNGLPLTATLSAVDTIPRPGTMEFFVTETGLTSPITGTGVQTFNLNLAVGQLSSNLWAVDEIAFIDPNNQPFGLTLAFFSPAVSFDHPATFVDSVMRDNTEIGPGPYSMTELIVVANDPDVQGIAGATIEVSLPSSATPLPATLPLFATGLGSLGLLGWRRKRKARAIA